MQHRILVFTLFTLDSGLSPVSTTRVDGPS